jgi:HNH endonuclease/NUMOD4 motif
VTEVIIGEEWRDVPGREGVYMVSSMGRVYSVPRLDSRGLHRGGNYLTSSPNSNGYLAVTLAQSNRRQTRLVHQLVCEAFCGPRPHDGTRPGEVRHLDGNKLNNLAVNLRWGTSLENAADRERHGTETRGSRNGKARLTEDLVREARLRYAAGEMQRDIASEFGVSQTAICLAISGRNWRHVQ